MTKVSVIIPIYNVEKYLKKFFMKYKYVKWAKYRVMNILIFFKKYGEIVL